MVEWHVTTGRQRTPRAQPVAQEGQEAGEQSVPRPWRRWRRSSSGSRWAAVCGKDRSCPPFGEATQRDQTTRWGGRRRGNRGG
eukprot:567574-Pyramimonas_sp.AAC.1